jgi:hypothetical protein
MASLHGYYPFYDYSSVTDPRIVYNAQAPIPTYPENTLMDMIAKNHPEFAFLARTAGLDWHLADLQTRATVFIPKNIPNFQNLDIQSAKKFVKYHMSVGVLPETVLHSSLIYDLQTTLNGYNIRVEHKLLNGVKIYSYDHYARNGIFHLIDSTLSSAD